MVASVPARRIVLSVNGFLPNTYGGGQVYVWRVAKELSRRRWEVSILSPRQHSRPAKGQGGVENRLFDDIKVIEYSLDETATSPLELYLHDGPHVRKVLGEILESVNPDVVHINAAKAALVGICNAIGIDHVVTAHHAGIACANGTLVTPSESFCTVPMSAKACIPCCVRTRWPNWSGGDWVRFVPPVMYRSLGRAVSWSGVGSKPARGLMYPWFVERAIASRRQMLTSAQQLIAPSRAMRELLVRNGCDSRTVRMIPHGIEPLERRVPTRLAGRRVRLGYIGRISPPKGLGRLIEAAGRLEDRARLELHVFGEPRTAQEERYQRDCIESSRGRVSTTFHGYVPPNEMQHAYQQVDVVVVPSRAMESFGLVVAEALSSGTPVVVTPSPALCEWVKDGVNGIVATGLAVEDLAHALGRMLATVETIIVGAASEGVRISGIVEHVDQLEAVYDGLKGGQGRGACAA